MFLRNQLDSDLILHGDAYRKRFSDPDHWCICCNCEDELYQGELVTESDGLIFCSPRCAREFYEIKEVDVKGIHICCNCDQDIDTKEYEIYSSGVAGELFCSLECAEEYLNIKTIELGEGSI